MKNWLKTALFAGLLATSSDLVLAKNPNLEKKFENLSDSQICQMIQNETKQKVVDVILWPETGKNKLITCVDGKVIFSSPAATGKRHKDGWVYTPEWIHNIGLLVKNKVSGTYLDSKWNKAKMPNAAQVIKWVYIHEWRVFNENWEVLEYPSHGCIRIPKWKAEEHFNILSKLKKKFWGVGVFIEWTNPNTDWKTFITKKQNKNPKK